jgi:hypothetical protein
MQFDKGALQKSLANGSLQFFCSYCRESWSPGEEEKKNIEDYLGKKIG